MHSKGSNCRHWPAEEFCTQLLSGLLVDAGPADYVTLAGKGGNPPKPAVAAALGEGGMQLQIANAFFASSLRIQKYDLRK